MIKGFRVKAPYCKHRIYIDGKRLSFRKSLKYIRIGYTGFEWGYGGAGPQQLAFAILLELTNEKIARTLLLEFTQRFVSKLPPKQNFSIPIEKAIRVIDECLQAEDLPDEYTTQIRVDLKKAGRTIH